MIDDLARDLRYAGRMFRRGPGFVAAAVLSLALGVGANTAIFSIVDRLMFRPLPVQEPSELIIVRAPQSNIDYAMFETLRDNAVRVASLAAIVRTDRYHVGITQNLGFDREHLLLIWTLPGQTGGRVAAAADFWQRVQQRLSSMPGVISTSASNQAS